MPNGGIDVQAHYDPEPLKTVPIASFKGKFKITRAGLVFDNGPGYTMPKDEGSSMLQQVMKKAQKTPAPGHVHEELTWKSVGAVFKSAPGQEDKRLTFCDEAIEKGKKTPAPGQYDARDKYKVNIPLGKME